MKEDETARYVASVVDAAPPLEPAQVAQLRAIISGDNTPRERHRPRPSPTVPDRPRSRSGQSGNNSYVYFVAPTDGPPIVKIGMTTSSPEERLAALQTGSPHRLGLLHSLQVANGRTARQLESHLHQRWSTHRRHGEWFDIEPGSELAMFLESPWILAGSWCSACFRPRRLQWSPHPTRECVCDPRIRCMFCQAGADDGAELIRYLPGTAFGFKVKCLECLIDQAEGRTQGRKYLAAAALDALGINYEGAS